MAISFNDVRSIVDQVKYKDGWTILIGEDSDRLYLQVSVDAEHGVCSVTKEHVAWKGGKKYLSPYMCKQEVVGACFAIIKEAEEHEMREWFRYKGASIFNPHLDPDVLVEVARKKSSFNTRPDNQSMTQEEPKMTSAERRELNRGMDELYGLNQGRHMKIY